MSDRFSIRGFTLVELMMAVLILAVALIPLLGVITTGAGDAELLHASAFAQSSARGILDYALDRLPFSALLVADSPIGDQDGGNAEPGVGLLDPAAGPEATAFLRLLGNPGTDAATRGTLTDERGLSYRVKLFVVPIAAGEKTPTEETLQFGLLERPTFEQARNERGQPAWYTTDPFVASGVQRPYDMTPARRRRTARDLGVAVGNDPRAPYCAMKRLLLRIRWTPLKGTERTLELVTAKADLSRFDR